MLRRLYSYLHHGGFALECLDKITFPAAIRFLVAPWTRRRLDLRLADGTTFQIRGRTLDGTVFREVFLKEPYKLSDYEPRRILDAGANIGAASVYFAQRFPKARIVAVEPEEKNFEVLAANAARWKNVLPVRGAVWSRRTVLRLSNPGAATVSFRVDEGQQGIGIEAYRIEDLDAMGGGGGFDMIKMDIEGAENEVFREAGSWLETMRWLFIEIHDRYSVGAGRTVLEKLGRRPFELSAPPGCLAFRFLD